MASEKQSDFAFLMLKQWQEQIELLSNEQKGKLLTAIYEYQCFSNDFITDDGMLKMLWATIKQTFDYNNTKYEERCKKNSENAKKRWQKENTNAYERIQANANNADIDKDIEKDIDIDFDKDNEFEKEVDIITSSKKAFRKKFDFSEYTENELTELYPLNTAAGLTIAEYDILYKLIYEQPLEKYLLKIIDYKAYDNFKTIIQWAKQDGNYKGGYYEIND